MHLGRSRRLPRENQDHQALKKMELQKHRVSYTYFTVFPGKLKMHTLKHDPTEQTFECGPAACQMQCSIEGSKSPGPHGAYCLVLEISAWAQTTLPHGHQEDSHYLRKPCTILPSRKIKTVPGTSRCQGRLPRGNGRTGVQRDGVVGRQEEGPGQK